MPEEVNEACIERYLDTHDIPDPDLLIRYKWRAEIVQLSFVAAMLIQSFILTDVSMAGFSRQELEKAN